MSECHCFRQLLVTIITVLFLVQKVNYSSVIVLQTGCKLPLLTETPVCVNCDKFTEDDLH
jgi:hypothetical protein